MLLYNPDSGTRRTRGLAQVHAAAAVLQSANIEAPILTMDGPEAATSHARDAALSGCDTVIACGGDGTIQAVLQGLIGLDVPVALGVIPLGTGNVLAHDLRMPWRPVEAARMLLISSPQRIAVGKMEYQNQDSRHTRYFISVAGLGVDAELFYRLGGGIKQQLGMGAYYASAFHQWAVQRFPRFQVEFFDSARGTARREIVTQLLAVRIGNFGGVLRRLAPAAGLDRGDFQLVLFKTASRTRYLRFIAGRLLDWHLPIRGIELAHASSVCCRPLSAENLEAPTRPSSFIHVEADGEPLGRLPASLSLVPEALTLLVPPGCRYRDTVISGFPAARTSPIGDAATPPRRSSPSS